MSGIRSVTVVVKAKTSSNDRPYIILGEAVNWGGWDILIFSLEAVYRWVYAFTRR